MVFPRRRRFLSRGNGSRTYLVIRRLMILWRGRFVFSVLARFFPEPFSPARNLAELCTQNSRKRPGSLWGWFIRIALHVSRVLRHCASPLEVICCPLIYHSYS